MSELLDSLRALTPAEGLGLLALVLGGICTAWLVARPFSPLRATPGEWRAYLVEFIVEKDGAPTLEATANIIAIAAPDARTSIKKHIASWFDVPVNAVTITRVTEVHP